MIRRRLSEILAPPAVVLALCAATLAPAAAQDLGEDQTPGGRALAEEVWETVRANFYDAEAVEGEAWRAMKAAHVDALPEDAGAAETAAAIDAMLASLEASHTRRFTPDEPAYYQIFDIFARAYSGYVDDVFAEGEPAYVGLGLGVVERDGRLFANAVYESGPAHAAGVLRGDELIALDGAPFSPVAALRDNTGQAVTLTLRREAGAEPIALSVTPRRLRPNRLFAQAMRAGARIIERAGDGGDAPMKIGYIHPWSYAGERYQHILVETLSRGALAEADALVLDLRGGWGGASPDYAEVFLGGAPSLVSIDRSGRERVFPMRWRKPLVVLIDGGSRSGKEALAYAFQQNGAPLVGERTAGALLAGRPFLLSDDSLLYLAVADVRIDGERLEGVGVAPDIEVPFTLPYAAGADPQLERAVEEAAKAVAARR